MKLKAYLKLVKKSPVEWAKGHESLKSSTVWRAYKGKGIPTLATVKAIEEASGGAVRFEDW